MGHGDPANLGLGPGGTRPAAWALGGSHTAQAGRRVGEVELGRLRESGSTMPSFTCLKRPGRSQPRTRGAPAEGEIEGVPRKPLGSSGSLAGQSPSHPPPFPQTTRASPGAHREAWIETSRGHRLVESLEAARGGAAGRDKSEQQRAQTSSSSWLTRPKIAVSICCSPHSDSRRSTRACSSVVRKWVSRLSASEQRVSASSPQDPGLGSRAQRSAGATARVIVPGAPSSPGPRAPAAAAFRVRSATIPSRLENQ